MLRAPSDSPARLAIELFCRGLRIDPSCEVDRDGRSIARTRAGLGSGLELCIPGKRKTHWVNAPVVEDFARRSPWLLVHRGAGYRLVDTRTGEEFAVTVPHEPDWYRARTASGIAMTSVGVLQGTYLGVYVGDVCGFWAGQALDACQFCTTGENVGAHESLRKSVADVVETAAAAKRESGVTLVHLNSGYAGEGSLDAVEPYVRALKEEVGVLVGVQSAPVRDLAKYDHLAALGADHFSFCYEFHDREVLERYCPGKARALGHETYFRALEYTSKLLGRGTCSGEIIAGVEPLEKTLEAIDWIASVGAFPTVCVFRPTKGSRMEHVPPPDPDEMEVVFREVWNACRRHLVPVGLAPGIEVSIVLTPDDTADLFGRPSLRDRAWRVALALGRAAAAPMFRRRMRPRTGSGASDAVAPGAGTRPADRE